MKIPLKFKEVIPASDWPEGESDWTGLGLDCGRNYCM